MAEIVRIQIGGSNRYTGKMKIVAQPLGLGEIKSQPKGHSNVLCGGEPTIRPDLPVLLTELKKHTQGLLSIRTDGILFSKAGLAIQMKQMGLDHAYVLFPTARIDAAEWLLGKGILNKVLRGIQNAIIEGLSITAEIPLTRPTFEYVHETVAILQRLGVKKILIRPYEVEGDLNSAVMLSPRYGLLEKPIQNAVHLGMERNTKIEFEGIPHCILKQYAIHQSKIGHRSDKKLRCNNCTERCSGVSQDYLLRFGWSEIWERQADESPTSLALFFSSQESTRSIRKRLMLASQSLVKELRLLGDFSHPDSYSILREAQRLSIDSIWLVGDLIPLRKLTKLELIRLRKIAVLAHKITLDTLPQEVIELFERWKVPQKILYACVSSPSEVVLFDQLFQQGKLPIAPFFRIEGTGDLQDFVDILAELSVQTANNLCQVLPYCLHQQQPGIFRNEEWMKYNSLDQQSAQNDIFPKFHPCLYNQTCQRADSCVGLIESYKAEKIKVFTSDE